MFEPNIKIATEEEKEEARRQQGMLGVRLSGKRFYCGKKLTDTCQHFFHGRGQFGRCGVDEDGKHFVQIVSINEEVKTQLAALSSDSAFHKFLQDCYDKACEIHAKRLETAKAAVKTDQDFGKYREETLKSVEKNLSEKRADQELALEQKKNKTPRVFTPEEKERMIHVQAYGQEDLTRNHSNLTKKKTNLLEQIQQCNQANISLKTERKPFDEKITKLKAKLDGDLNEAEFKDVKLSLEYYELKIQKIEVKIEKNNEKKAELQDQLDGIEKQIDILNCILDHYNLLNEIKNFEDRKTRVVTRVEKVLSERNELYTMRTNLNSRWNELLKPEEADKKRISVFSQSPPEKEEELCEALALKASADVYFI